MTRKYRFRRTQNSRITIPRDHSPLNDINRRMMPTILRPIRIRNGSMVRRCIFLRCFPPPDLFVTAKEDRVMPNSSFRIGNRRSGMTLVS